MTAQDDNFFDTQISLTEWFERIGHKDVALHRVEDNEKRERLAILNDVIGLPFDRPVQFSATDISERTPAFVKYFEENSDTKCALRLIPLDPSLQKLRMRGRTVKDVVENWFPEQGIDPTKYRADFVPHADETYWATIFVVTDQGVVGEIIADSHEKLTQGFHESVPPILFQYNFDTWNLEPENKEAEEHLETLLSYLLVPDDAQSVLTEKLDATFSNGYLKGYFETSHGDQGTWFIDYNRLLGEGVVLQSNDENAGSDLTGQCASKGTVEGVVRIISDPSQNGFIDGEILVCDMTSPLYLPLMQKSAAIVTDRGGITSHAAIVAREMKKPCVVNTKVGTKVLKDGDRVEVHAEKGTVKILK